MTVDFKDVTHLAKYIKVYWHGISYTLHDKDTPNIIYKIDFPFFGKLSSLALALALSHTLFHLRSF